MIVQEPVQAAIWHCLNNYAFRDATFLAERLCAEIETDESIFTLATCYYRSNQIHQAYWLLNKKKTKAAKCRYLYAKCAFELKKYNVVEVALTRESNVEIEHLDRIVDDFADIASFALQLLAKLCSVTDRHQIAAHANRRALKLNPFLWTPFVSLCNHGHKPVPNEIYKFDNIETFHTCQENFNWNSSFIFLGAGDSTDVSLSESDDSSRSYSIYTTPIMDQNVFNANDRIISSLNTSCTTTVGNVTASESLNDSSVAGATPFRRQFRYLSNISPSTPSFGWLPANSPVENTNTRNSKMISPTFQQQQQQQQQQQMLSETNEQNKYNRKNLRSNVTNSGNRKEAPLQISKPVFMQTGNTTPRTQNTLGAQNVRRSSRLFTSNSVKENSKNPMGNKFAAPRSPPRKNKQRLTTKMNLSNSALNEINAEKPQKQISDLDKEKIETITSTGNIMNTKTVNNTQNVAKQILIMRKQSAEGLMSLMRILADGYLQMSQFNCIEAIEAFNSIPYHHLMSTGVQSMIAKAYHEKHDYKMAAQIFMEIHRKEPNRLEMMEIYSTVLWHLQREVELSALAQDLKAQDYLSPITWCVLGNCFSLQKEHESATKCFERAVQVDPDFTYSYTLLGHELIITEELDKAMSCFRTAIVKDPRHYNAWYGMASIYSKQERHHLAEYHFKEALKINPKWSVMMVHIAVTQFNLNKTEQALETLNAAIAIDPNNPLCKFHRGSIYFQCGRYVDALKELEQLKHTVPKESVVFYIVGKIHKKMGNVDLSLMNYSWATDLDPKGANNQVKEAFDGQNNSTMPLLTPDAHEAASDRSDDSTQLRGGEDGDEPSLLNNDDF
ncbi:cell division cycle protein 27 homolog isoform X2 [Contarinia nasturtii]|uniref:cell division cycle protein 27 homolog isoform X1 n=1 Tax=Contarinia nasturtii TaxID=265458 RepID=UPI0012D49817|nr:cell division cycle protein 27 homolog isoform X1 [Contarinia nasturtii]XP_031634064.1 cell division cycle protein 27 homolog isoform X1 [Contarinia nasturtii]XP_031634065.1 cell division cycle protein 27 homolog isoform X1 [Contarinia nasturtii]XP_031634066.1 cell division cycle protein 27 homolog isoform X2 [Contarinia nasturtii]XP_031634067.1 cell division cycle protein 27 homolog isoform X2 [Contarinia nasturtii]XP_031634068.1 cell division cycle protein 27 homolog isoform X2 [Contarini